MATTQDVVAILRNEIGSAGSLRKLAKSIGVSASYLCDVMNGRNEPTGPILDYLRLERQVSYEPQARAAKRNGAK